MARAVDAVRATGAAVVIFGTVPEQHRWAGDCTAIIATRCGDPSTRFERGRRGRVIAAERAIADRRDGVALADPFDVFCSRRSCRQELHGRLAYRDDDHLNALGAYAVAPVVAAGIDAATREARS
jgi:hypothetical protein